MIPGYLLLAQRIRDELAEIERTVNRAKRSWDIAKKATADQDIYIDSAALNLHGFYSGLERLLEYAAYQLDGGPPQGQAWHKELLRQMSTPLTPVRPAMISAEMAQRLDEFRRFRHLVRNIYAEHLDPQRVGDLVEKLTGLWDDLRHDLTQFAYFLEGVSAADDQL